MTWTQTAIMALVLLTGIVGAALYAGIETGVYMVNRVRLAVRVENGDPGATRLQNEILDSTRILITLLVGTNLMTHLASFAVTSFCDHWALGEWVGVLVLTPTLFVFSESLPKDLFRAHCDRWLYRWTWLLRWSRRVFTICGLTPLVLLCVRLTSRRMGKGRRSLDASVPGMRRREMVALLKEGVGAGLLSEHQTTLLDRALALRDLPVTSEMIPWSAVVRVDASMTLDAVVRSPRLMAYSWLPVVDRRGVAIGMLFTLDAAVHAADRVRDHVRPVGRLSEDATLRQALEQLRRDHTPIAIVERAGRPAGLATLKDLARPLVGGSVT
jgi:putative hemolysin